MKKLTTDAQHEIGRDALREACWAMTKPMREATYTSGFKRITGAIRTGLSVAVQHDPKDDRLKAYVVEYPQKISGAETPFKTLVRKRAARAKKKVDLQQVAFWWRYLEFGTNPRKSVATPKAKRRNLRPGTRSARARARWEAAPSRGGIKPMPWLRPTFNQTGAQAINSCRDIFTKLIDAAVSAMPKR